MQKIVLFAVAFAILGVAFAKPVGKEEHPYTESLKQCKHQLGLDSDYTIGVPALPSTGPVLLCLNVKLGIQDAKGHVNADALRTTILDMGIPKEKADEIVERCGKNTSDKAEDNAVNLFNCIHK